MEKMTSFLKEMKLDPYIVPSIQREFKIIKDVNHDT